MGQRANLVVVTASGVELHYTHWRANSLDRDLVFGPDHATAFARAQRSEAEGAEWLDEVWAEGGAVIDHVHRELLWWGGEDVKYDVPLRRTHLAVMQRLWAGWTITWASGGLLDLALRMGVPREHVLARDDEGRSGQPVDLDQPGEPSWVDAVLSTRRHGEVQVYPVVGSPVSWLLHGEGLLAALAGHAGLASVDLAALGASFPLGGAHLDLDHRAVAFWQAHPYADAVGRVKSALPGLAVASWGDAFERHLEEAPGAITFPAWRVEDHIEQIRARCRSTSKPYDLLETIAVAHPGEKVEVNPFALRDDTGPASTDELFEALDRALDEVLREARR